MMDALNEMSGDIVQSVEEARVTPKGQRILPLTHTYEDQDGTVVLQSWSPRYGLVSLFPLDRS